MDDIEFEWQEISSSTAADILLDQAIGAEDRLWTNPKVLEYAADMHDRKWRRNGDALIFDDEGKLLDGFKRLAACIKADCPFVTLVVYRIPAGAAATIGIHRKRNFADTMKILGYGSNSAAVSRTAAFVHALQERKWDRTVRSPAFTRNAMVAMVSHSPELCDCVRDAVEKADRRLVTPATYAAVLFAFSRVDSAAACRFADMALCSGKIPAPPPLDVLRRRLEGERTKARALESRELFALVILTWNAWRQGQSPKIINWRSAGEHQQPFPAIAGWSDGCRISTSDDATEQDAADDAEDSEIEVTLEHIGETRALEYLEHMVPNRNVLQSNVDPIARDLEQGRWTVNGQTIKFDKDGYLCDGQHRLTACLQAGVALDTIVVRGLSKRAFTTFDIQQTRGFRHYLETAGQSNASHIAAALKVLWIISHGVVGKLVTPSNTELEAYWLANSSVGKLQSSWGPLKDILPPSTSIAVGYLLRNVDETKADLFLEKLQTGENLSGGDPILVARNYLMSIRHGERKRTSGGYGQVYTTAALLINAWNAWRKGTKVGSPSKLSWDGKVDFPVPA